MIRKLKSGEYRLYSRKVNPKTRRRSIGYMLESERASANFGGWEAGVFHPYTAAQRHRKAMDVFQACQP